jgi:glycosyltransferase involved in cell wall biosynthesis
MIDRTEEEIMQTWKGNKKFSLVSICTITYNHERYIAEAIDSFLMQETNFPFEILIDDDCSSDKTADIIRTYANKYPNLIKANLRKTNIGGPENFIANIKKAKSKYIALCEGDDYWTNAGKLQKQVDFLESHEEYNLVFHNAELQHHTESGVEIEPFNPERKSREFTADEILKKWSIPTASVLFRNNNQYRYREDRLWFPVGDTPLFIKCASLGKLYYIAEILSVYRKVPTGVMNSEEFQGAEFSLNFVKYLKTLHNDFSNIISKDSIRHESAHHYYNAAYKYKRNDDIENYWKYLALAVKNDPEYVYEIEILAKETSLKTAKQEINHYKKIIEDNNKLIEQQKQTIDNTTAVIGAIQKLTQYPIKKHPIKKYNAYKKMLKTYFQIKLL